MKRIALALLVVLELVPSAGAGGAPPLYGVEWRLGGGVSLVRLDRMSLVSLGTTRIDLGSATDPQTLSPDRQRLLAAGNNQLRIADLRTGRVTQSLAPGGWVVQTLWTRPNTIVVVTGTRAVVVDARRMRTLRYVELGGAVVGSVQLSSRIALLIGPDDAIGPLRVALVDGNGRVRRSARLPMRGGNATLRNEERNLVGTRSETPGFAIDRTGTRALVVGRSGIVEVDLATLDATSHMVGTRETQKRIEGWWRTAVWLDEHHVAVSGADYNGDERPTHQAIRVLDVRDWSEVRLEDTATYIVGWHGRLLAVGSSVRSYAPDGGYVSTLLAERSRGQIVAGSTHIYVETAGSGRTWLVLDGNGRVVGRRTFARPMNLVEL